MHEDTFHNVLGNKTRSELFAVLYTAVFSGLLLPSTSDENTISLVNLILFRCT